MDAKKSKSANVERLRIPITLMGLLFTGSLVLASFTYTNEVERTSNEKLASSAIDIQFLEEPNKPEPPEPPKVEPQTVIPPTQNIIIDSNKQKEPPKIVIVTPPDIKKGPEVVIKEDKIIDYPDVEAAFPGGAAAMQRWIAENVQYPQTAIEMNEQGKVYLSFVVEKDGSISNISIERGVSADIDKEAKRLLRKMPKWDAGESEGSKARTRCRLPINFTLN